MHEGYNIYTPTFESITATDKKLNLQDIKLKNTDGWGTEIIWVMNEDGTSVTGETYNWQNGEANGFGIDGWIDDNGALADVSLVPGEGLYLNCGDLGSDGESGVQIEIDPGLIKE